jgi:single-stranded DNA-binding protein
MSGLFALASGSLIADPAARDGAKGRFATATIRAGSGDEAVLVSVIAFGGEADRLLEHVKGDALAVSGRASLRAWTGRDGAEKHGLSVVVDQIAAAKPRPRQRRTTDDAVTDRAPVNNGADRPFNDPLPF